MELATVNPVGVFGPVLGPDFSTSILLTQRLLDGDVPGCPNLVFGGVDVRDVADLHIRAMIDPAAKGERFLAVTGQFVPMVEIARILKRRMGPAGARVPTRRLPDWVVRIVAMFDPAVKVIAAELGKVKNATSDKAIRMLGWAPRSLDDTMAATGQSLLDLGLLKASPKTT